MITRKLLLAWLCFWGCSTGALAGGLAPSQPTSLVGTTSGNTINLSWDASTDDGEIGGYNVYRNNQYLTTVNTNNYSGPIEADTLYSYTIVAYDDDAPTLFSETSASIELPVNLIPEDLTIPPTTPNQLVGSIDDTLVNLNWQASTDDETVQGYNVYRNNQYISTVNQPEYTGSVTAGEFYSFYVVAFDIRNNFSGQSEKLRLPDPGDIDTTIPPSNPSNLAGLVIEGEANDIVEFTWTKATDDQAVAGYNIYINNDYLTTVSDNFYTGVVPSGSNNVFSVAAFDFDGNFSNISEGLYLPEPDGSIDFSEPPTIPGTPTGTLNSQATIVTLSWEASNDNVGVTGYNLYKNNAYLTTIAEPAYTGAVEPGTFNSFYVVAFDVHGNFSNQSATATVPEDNRVDEPPSTPLALEGSIETVNGQSVVTLEWQPSVDERQVLGYNLYRNNRYLTSQAGTSYTDLTEDGLALSYYVIAYDSGGNFSNPSERLVLVGSENQPPFFTSLDDQTTLAGSPWTLVLNPVDIDGGAPGIIVGNLPTGMTQTDNFDGTRTLAWTPTSDDIGNYEITVIAVDAADTTLQSTYAFILSVSPEDGSGAPPFTINTVSGSYNLLEGDIAGVSVPIGIIRSPEFTDPVMLSIEGLSPEDDSGVQANFTSQELIPGDDESLVNLTLQIGRLPRLPGQRSFRISGRSGDTTDTTTLSLALTPVQRDDVYLLIGQSNMVGASEAGAKQSAAGQADEIHPRIQQANVSPNKSAIFSTDIAWTDVGTNFSTPLLVPAEDPLHEPVDPTTLLKSGDQIGPGLSFAKAAINSTTRNIVLVPAAWSGTSYCDTEDFGAEWNGSPSTEVELGNTFLFDRALTRVNHILLETGGILRGIIWLQGESEKSIACANLYQENIINMVEQFRSTIVADARGSSARGVSSDIPFVLGTMSRGSDERGDYSFYDTPKSTVNSVHRTVSSILTHADFSNHDDLVPMNGYPCGEGDCVHFGAAAYREIGSRLFDTLLRAATQ